MNSRKIRMLTLLSAVSGLALVGSGALAQTAADATANPKDDVVVVTGQRKALQTAQQRKRNAEEIVDSITAVDIGALPDRSVTEALQRVAGVTIGRTSEPRDIDRLNVEGSGVMIRGLTWVRSEINGRDSFGAKGGRTIGWEDVTPELAAGVDVYKNPSAEIVEGGLGGTVNLRTWMPFDSKGDKLAFSADATYGDLRKEWTPSASVLVSKRFDTNWGEMGVLVDVAHSQLKTRMNALEVDPYNAHGSVVQSSYDGGATFNFNGDCADPTKQCNEIAGTTGTVMTPTGAQFRIEDADKTRDGLYGAFQWKPNDKTLIYATYFRSSADQINQDHFAQTGACCSATNNQMFLSGPAAGSTFTYDANGNYLSGTIVDGGGGGNPTPNSFQMQVGTNYRENKDWTADSSLGFKWEGERWAITGDFQYINAHRSNYDMTLYNAMTVRGGIGLDLTSKIPTLTAGAITPSDYYLSAAMDHSEIDDAHQYTAKFDASYSFDNGFFKSIKFGARATDRTAIQRDGGYNWGLVSALWYSTQTASVQQFPDHQETLSFSNFFHGDAANPPSIIYPTMDLAKDRNAAYAYLQKIWWQPNVGTNLQPYTDGTYGYYCDTCGNGTIPSWASNGGQYSPFPQGSLMSYSPIWQGVDPAGIQAKDPRAAYSSFWVPFNGNYNYVANTVGGGIGTNRQEEKTDAIYMMVRFGQDTLFGNDIPFDGNFGVRIVKTDLTSVGLAHVPFISYGTSPSSYSAAALDAVKFGDGSNFYNTQKNQYTNVLPSLNLRFKPNDTMVFRFAAASSIVRPDFYQLQPSFSMGATAQTRPATVSDNVFNDLAGHNYTQQELDTAAAAGAPITYTTGYSFNFYAGNPNLKPMRANSFDLAYEWYFKPGSMLALGVFDKEIYDYIQSDQSVLQYTHNGVTENVVGTIPLNHGHGKVRGIEFQHTQWYDFLPGALSGLGTDFNATFLETQGTQNVSANIYDTAQIASSKVKLPLEQMSRYSYNFTAMYNKYNIDARLAYNWRSRYLLSASASNVQAPAYMEDYGQLDGSLLYTLNRNFKIGVQATNLNNAKSIIDIDERDNWYYGTQGRLDNYLIYKHNFTVVDKRFTIVLRGTF